MNNNYGNSNPGVTGGITGLDEQRARYDIENLKERLEDCSMSFANCFVYLFGDLANVWASPNAKKFHETYNKKILDTEHEIFMSGRILLQNVVRAYNIMARANGSMELDLSYYVPGEASGLDSVVYTEDGLPPLFDQLNGVVGMNTAMVINYILPEFYDKVSVLFNLIDELSSSIALYDNTGEQQEAFNTFSLNYKSRVESMVNEIVSSLKTNIEIEVNTTLLAKQQSVDSLMNG